MPPKLRITPTLVGLVLGAYGFLGVEFLGIADTLAPLLLLLLVLALSAAWYDLRPASRRARSLLFLLAGGGSVILLFVLPLCVASGLNLPLTLGFGVIFLGLPYLFEDAPLPGAPRSTTPLVSER